MELIKTVKRVLLKVAGQGMNRKWFIWIDGLAAFGVLLGFLFHYYLLVISPAFYNGTIMDAYTRVASGNEYAPFQYRILMPWLVTTFVDLDILSARHVVLVVEGVSLILGSIFLVKAAYMIGGFYSPTIVTLYVVFWGFGTILYPKPETFIAYAAVNLAVITFLQRSRTLAVFPIVIFVLSLTRSDLLVTLAIPYMVRWLLYSRRTDLGLAITIGLAGICVVGILMYVYSPTYPPGVSAIQIWYNLNPLRLMIPAIFFAPVVCPLVRKLRRQGFLTIASDKTNPLLLWPLAYFILTLILGRIDEVRLYFPFAGFLGMTGMSALWPSANGPSKEPA